MALGASATPTTVIEWDQQRTIIVGFDQAKLARLLLDDTMLNPKTVKARPRLVAFEGRGCGGRPPPIIS